MTETEKAMKSLCERITMSISGDIKHQVLSPSMVHVVDRMDRRKQEALLGSEVFRFSHCIPSGKAPIFCFRPVRPASYRLMELELEDLANIFPDFYVELETYMNGNTREYIKNYLLLFEQKQAEQDRQAKLSQYGEGWGRF